MSNEVLRIRKEDYHSDKGNDLPALSRSTIHDLLFKTPFHAWLNHPKLNPNWQPDYDEKFDIGTAAHSLLLEGKDCCAVIVADDWRTKAAKEARELARAEGKTPLLQKQYDSANMMVESAKKQIRECEELQITNLRKEGDAELSYKWTKDGILYKSRVDWISKDRKLILDYKTEGQSANPDGFWRKVISCGLDIQAALYPQGVEACEGIKPKFVFAVQEVEPPYLMSFIELHQAFKEMGLQKIDYGSFLWKRCLDADSWPAYPKTIAKIEPPVWALNQWEDMGALIGIEEG